MASAADLNAFINYLNGNWNIAVVNGKTYGEPYVIGGQHTRVTPATYKSYIHSREDGTGSYTSGPYKGTTYEQAAKDYCKRLFDAGLTELFCSDCSGLGMYWLYNVKHFYSGDLRASGMAAKCTLYKDTPKRGWWVFRKDQGRVVHIGYMVDDTYLIHDKGRAYGVEKKKFKKSEWHTWGVPKIWKDVIQSPDNPHPGHTYIAYQYNYIFAPGGGYFFPPH